MEIAANEGEQRNTIRHTDVPHTLPRAHSHWEPLKPHSWAQKVDINCFDRIAFFVCVYKTGTTLFEHLMSYHYYSQFVFSIWFFITMRRWHSTHSWIGWFRGSYRRADGNKSLQCECVSGVIEVIAIMPSLIRIRYKRLIHSAFNRRYTNM